MTERLPGFSAERDHDLAVFMPQVHRRLALAHATGQRFVHYTSAPAAMNIIQNGELWLRNTQCMNDFSEVRHGLDLLRRAYRGIHGQKLIGFLESVYPGFRVMVEDRFDALEETVAYDTYICCVSEHDAREDTVGRLSMWRAYSNVSGIAFVLRSAPLIGPGSDHLAVFSGPVIYAERRSFFERFGEFVDGVLREAEYVAGLGMAQACHRLVGSYHLAALSTKHPGFSEEREWRMAFTPSLQPTGDLVRAVELCRNEPQTIYKLPLVARPGPEGASTALGDFVEEVIIGPSATPRAVRDAFVDLLQAAGVANAAAMVRISDIPIR
jgi:hypothetical protein